MSWFYGIKKHLFTKIGAQAIIDGKMSFNFGKDGYFYKHIFHFLAQCKKYIVKNPIMDF